MDECVYLLLQTKQKILHHSALLLPPFFHHIIGFLKGFALVVSLKFTRRIVTETAVYIVHDRFYR